jgi:peptidyl-prolyl cis-trans isomerase D
VSGIIKTAYGIHLLKVIDKQNAHLETLDEINGALRATLEKQKMEAAEQSFAYQIEGELKANPQNFDAVVRKAGLQARETPPFRYGEKLPDFGDSQSFAELSFQLPQGQVGEPITVPKGLAIIQVSEVVPEHVPKLDEVRARVEQDYRAEQSKLLASQKAREFAARVKNGDFKKLAQAQGLKVKESKDFTQQENVDDLIPGSAVTAAFTLAPGQTSDVASPGNNNLVFRVASHTPANEADFAAQADRIREELLDRKRYLAFEIYRQNLKQDLIHNGQLKINDAAMRQFLASYRRP